MTEAIPRIVSFAGSSVRIECAGPDAVALVDFLYSDLPPAEHPNPHVELRVEADTERATFTLACNGTLTYRAHSIGDFASALVGQTMHHLSDRCAGGLLLHAAAVVVDDRCVLMPGPTGSGKTTLTAWLVAKGFRYLTDELVFVPHGSDSIVPFIRPLSVKRSAMDVLAEYVRAHTDRALEGAGVTLLPFRSLGRAANPPIARLDSIVFPKFEAGAPLEAEPVAKSEAGMRLMGCLINARNLAGHGFTEVVRLARDVPVSQLRYGHLNQLDEWIDTWTRSAVSSSREQHD